MTKYGLTKLKECLRYKFNRINIVPLIKTLLGFGCSVLSVKYILLALVLSHITIDYKCTALTKPAASVRFSSTLSSKCGHFWLQNSETATVKTGVHKPVGHITVATPIICYSLCSFSCHYSPHHKD